MGLVSRGVVIVGCAWLVGCASSQAQVRGLLPEIETDLPSFGVLASTVDTFRIHVEDAPLTARFLAHGSGAAEVLRERIADPNLKNADQAISLYAYVLEKIGDTAAIPTLEAYILSGPGTRHHYWAPQFAIRALLVLKGRRDFSRGYQLYEEADVRRALEP